MVELTRLTVVPQSYWQIENYNIMTQLKVRGTNEVPANRFQGYSLETDPDFLEYCHQSDEELPQHPTRVIEVFPKTILNKVTSPDVGLSWSLNPYQGCEHGCIYCYARNSHEYWGYNAGVDFESVILAKTNAPELLKEQFEKKSWEPVPIMLSGNTDCYQPIEAKLRITRRILEVCLAYNHPVGIITKNALVARDIDLLRELAKHDLVKVTLSITSLDESLRRKLEPRTASASRKLKTIKQLRDAGVPVHVMLAPMIPGINAHEMIPLVKRVSEVGAQRINYLVVRLNGHNGLLFAKWLDQHFPDRKRKVLNMIKSLHGGRVSDTRFGTRMRGEGTWASSYKEQFELALKIYHRRKGTPAYNINAFKQTRSPQLALF